MRIVITHLLDPSYGGLSLTIHYHFKKMSTTSKAIGSIAKLGLIIAFGLTCEVALGQTGVSDGVLSSVTNATSANWHEILKCYLDTRLVLSESFTLTSKKWISSLPADLRRLVLEVCEESEDVNLQEVSKQYQLGRRKMAEAGVTFIELEQLELAELKQKAFAFRDTYMKSKGAVVYDFYQKWIKHVEEKTGRPQKM